VPATERIVQDQKRKIPPEDVASAIQEVRRAIGGVLANIPGEVPEPGHRTGRGGWIELHGSATRALGV